MTSLRCSIVLTLAVLVTLTPYSSPSRHEPPQAVFTGAVNGRIAFRRHEPTGWGNIAVMNPDGSGATTLVPRAAEQYEPDWSPDGSKVAFASNQDGFVAIFVVNADGSGLTRIGGSFPGNNGTPAWSPDGSKIAFTHVPSNYREVYVMNADGTGVTNLTYDDPNFEDTQQDDLDPTWSPEGSRIAFVRGRLPKLEIYVMNADGTGRTRLTYDNGCALSPSWSPDGSRIAFASNRHNNLGVCNNLEIHVMDSDGSNVTRLTTGGPNVASGGPTWSPDGTMIAFVRGFDTYRMNADGSGLTLLNSAGGYTGLDWGTNTEPLNPMSRADCMNDGWQRFRFRNQGQCIKYIETGEDSR